MMLKTYEKRPELLITVNEGLDKRFFAVVSLHRQPTKTGGGQNEQIIY